MIILKIELHLVFVLSYNQLFRRHLNSNPAKVFLKLNSANQKSPYKLKDHQNIIQPIRTFYEIGVTGQLILSEVDKPSELNLAEPIMNLFELS